MFSKAGQAMWWLRLLTTCLLAQSALPGCKPFAAAQETSTTSSAPQTAPTICGDIIGLANADLANNWLFWASDVYACLTSVPFLDAVAYRYTDYLNTTIQFQSTLAYLKDPPAGYQQPGVDVQQALDDIRYNITAGNFANEYDYEATLYSLVQRMHDAHVSLTSGLLAAFSFGSPYDIMSLSVDGKQPPKIYVALDVINSPGQGWSPSAIETINGQDAVRYLESFAAVQSVGMLEPDADWNQLMYSPIEDILGTLNLFGWNAVLYPGDDLILGFENGTSQNIGWYAYYQNTDQTGPLTTGGDFYNYFVLGFLPASYLANNTAYDNSNGTSNSNTTMSGNLTSWGQISGAYPTDPDIVQPGLSIGGSQGVLTGYYLEDISTGVLSIPNFEQWDEDAVSFSNTTSDFIQGAQAAGLTKIVIDLQGNFGGDPLMAIDTFQQFFPNIDPFAGSRRRDHYLDNILGGAMTDFWDELTVSSDNDGDTNSNDTDISDDDLEFYYELIGFMASDEWVVTDRLSAATEGLFESWQEYYGPLSTQDDQFSQTERYNLSDELFDESAAGFIPLTVSDQSPPWSSQNIILLTDGSCSSACSLFVEMMTHDAGVRTVVVGGRPSPGPMQAASGSRGARSYSVDDLDLNMVIAGLVNDTANVTLPQVREQAIYTEYLGFNLRDQIRENETVPLQFQYLAADCRIYYTFANAVNMSRLWRDAAAAIWTDTSLCVSGSTGYAATTNASTQRQPPPRTAQALPLNHVQSGKQAQIPFGFSSAFTADGSPRDSGSFPPCNGNCATGKCILGVCCASCSEPGRRCGSGNRGICTGATRQSPSKLNTVSADTTSEQSSQGQYVGFCELDEDDEKATKTLSDQPTPAPSARKKTKNLLQEVGGNLKVGKW